MFKDEYARVNGIRLHYVTAGEGKLMLFLHGFPEFWYEWRRQLAAFKEHRRVVAPDMRGYNLSDKPAPLEQYQIKHIVEDVRALQEHLGHQKMVLVGHDWGGIIAWAFALYHPECLEKLIIINAPHPAVFERELRDNPAQQKASEYMFMLKSPEAESIIKADNWARYRNGLLARGRSQGGFTDEECQAYMESWERGGITGGLNYYRAANLGPPGADGKPWSAAEAHPGLSSFVVKVPTLVIWGEQDRALLTGNLEGLEQFVPDMVVKRVPEGTHSVMHDHTELVNSYMRDFLGIGG